MFLVMKARRGRVEVSSAKGYGFEVSEFAVRTGLGGEMEISNSLSEYCTVRRQSHIPSTPL
jgi:hypothetical protein